MDKLEIEAHTHGRIARMFERIETDQEYIEKIEELKEKYHGLDQTDIGVRNSYSVATDMIAINKILIAGALKEVLLEVELKSKTVEKL